MAGGDGQEMLGIEPHTAQPAQGISPVPDERSDKEKMENQREMLIERMESEFGLMDKMRKSLTVMEIAEVKSKETIFKKNQRLLELIFENNKHQDLIRALSDTRQTHLVNWVRGNGEYRVEFFLDWPLNKKEIDMLDDNLETLTDIVDPCELVFLLFSKKVINKRQMDFIQSKRAKYEQNEELLNILRRFSLAAYYLTIDCLHTSNQGHIAYILEGIGDTSRNHTVQDDVIGPLTQSPQHSSGQHSAAGDSGFSPESASSVAFHSKSSGSVVELELETPIQMSTEEMKSCTSTQEIGEGGFGKVYKGEYKKKTVAIKTGRFIKSNERQFLKEMQLAFIRNIFTVPILAYTVEKDGMMMIMYPYMDNGDLNKVCHRLDWRDRLRVFYQCSEGLAFLHRPVEGVRNEIIHGDIKPANILLDANLNARLGGFGMAAELTKGATLCTATANMFYGTEEFEDPFHDEDVEKVIRRKEDDVFSLGIVGLQFLKWPEAVQYEEGRTGAISKVRLWDKLKKQIEPLNAQQLISSDNFFDKNIWHQAEKDSKVNKEVAELILACLEPPKESIAAQGLACKLKELLVTNNIPKYIFTEDKFCQYCCVNVADTSSTLILCSDTCPEHCKFKHLCKSCHHTAYRNPLYCPEHGRLKRPEECFAILISGFDDDDEWQKTFDDDTQMMHNVISNPRVLGFSQDNVILINKSTMEKSKEIRNAIQELQKKSVEMLIVYYSGHGTKEGVPELNISKGNTDNVKDQELKELLDSVKCTRLLVILDCCYAARYEVVLPKPHGASDSRIGWRVQLNGAGASKEADMTEDNNSMFTRHLNHAINLTCPLEGEETDENALPCRMCTKFKTLSEARGHIDLYDVVGFCSEHIKLEAKNEEEEDQESSMIAGELNGSAPLIPYTPFKHIFRFQNKEESKKFHLNNLKHEPDQILQQLWNKINACYSLPKLSGACYSLPKHTDYRCLKMQGLVRAKEKEITTRDELLQQFIRGHIVQVCIRSTGSDLDSERHVVVFCSQHDKFTDILNSLETVFKPWFKKEEPRKDIEAEYSCIIKCGETDEITNMWKILIDDDERRNFSDVVRDSVSRANTISREHLRVGKPPISGLRIDVTTEFAFLALI